MSDVPEELTKLDRELRGVTRRVEQRIDPGTTAVTVSIAMFVLIGSLFLPWTGSALGWQVLSGEQVFGLLPRLFSFTSLGFGDIVPTGAVRLLAGAECLNGLLLIGWSASYTATISPVASDG